MIRTWDFRNRKSEIQERQPRFKLAVTAEPPSSSGGNEKLGNMPRLPGAQGNANSTRMGASPMRINPPVRCGVELRQNQQGLVGPQELGLHNHGKNKESGWRHDRQAGSSSGTERNAGEARESGRRSCSEELSEAKISGRELESGSGCGPRRQHEGHVRGKEGVDKEIRQRS